MIARVGASYATCKRDYAPPTFSRDPRKRASTGALAGLAAKTVGNIGLFYVCYRLSRLGWSALPTTRNAKGIDIVLYSGRIGDGRIVSQRAEGVWDSTWKRIDGKYQLTRPYGKKVRFPESSTEGKRMLQRNESTCLLAKRSFPRPEMIPDFRAIFRRKSCK